LNALFYTIVSIIVFWSVLFLVYLWLLRKHVVTVPQITLAITPVTPPGQYDHGATVNVTGTTLADVGPPSEPGAGDTVELDLTDSAGTDFSSIGSAVAGSDGTYAASFVVPGNAAPGQATLTATDTKTGAKATATFTLSNPRNIHLFVNRVHGTFGRLDPDLVYVDLD
jgi:hypothetical protein